MNALASAIDALLPQTQCTRCSYTGCKPYADAIADNAANINQCPPGGAATIVALAALLNRQPLALDALHGVETEPVVAVIDESRCIGCAKCLPPCPVDAIVGAPRQMHTVLYAACTGCQLCVAPCPVDCISLLPRTQLQAQRHSVPPSAATNRHRFEAKETRLARAHAERAALLAERKANGPCAQQTSL